MLLNLSSLTSAEDDWREELCCSVQCRGCRGHVEAAEAQFRGCRGSEDDIRGRDTFVGVGEAAEQGVAAACTPGQ